MEATSEGLSVLTDEEVGLENDRLHLPPTANSAFREIYDEGTFQKVFYKYYHDQLARIKTEDDVPNLHAQEAFDAEGEFFSIVTNSVELASKNLPGCPLVVLFDADETIGRIPETKKHIEKPGITDIPQDQRTAAQQEEFEELHHEDAYKRFQIRPVFSYLVKHLYARYKDTIQFGILTTKEQTGLNKYLVPVLDELCPGMFPSDMVMSCKNGAADILIPDIVRQLHSPEKQDIATLKDVSEKVFSDTKDQTVMIRSIIDPGSREYDAPVSVYDAKLLMMAKLLEQSRQAGINQLQKEPPKDINAVDDWATHIQPESVFMLFDDATLPVLPSHERDASINCITVPRFRLPDDIV